MPITFTLELNSKSTNKGEHLIMIRCSQKHQHKRINTGIHIEKKFWDPRKKQVKAGCVLRYQMNSTLAHKINALKETYLKLQQSSDAEIQIDDLIEYSTKPKSVNFFDFAYKHKLVQFQLNKKLGTYRRYEAVLNKLKVYAGTNLATSKIDYSLLKGFESYCMLELKNSRDTASSNLSVIRSILKEAIRHQYYEGRNPFEMMALKYTDNTKLKLTLEELSQLENVALPSTASLLLARDFFMACYYAGGCRGGDMVEMKWSSIKEGVLTYHQRKTGKLIIIPVLEPLNKIFGNLRTEQGYFQTILNLLFL